ncbi:hypothetical protein HHI36_001054 [Cryptolaemus montrouzieri]|uniref:Uncharacterized protein n=1 Tax=Cryptolaemus montrouzieri TaxID=559131 RepID=A0ABD2P7T6_9CUCU
MLAENIHEDTESNFGAGDNEYIEEHLNELCSSDIRSQYGNRTNFNLNNIEEEIDTEEETGSEEEEVLNDVESSSSSELTTEEEIDENNSEKEKSTNDEELHDNSSDKEEIPNDTESIENIKENNTDVSLTRTDISSENKKVEHILPFMEVKKTDTFKNTQKNTNNNGFEKIGRQVNVTRSPEYISLLGPDSFLKSGSRIYQNIDLLKEGGNTVSDEERIALMLADTYQSLAGNDNLHPDFIRYKAKK